MRKRLKIFLSAGLIFSIFFMSNQIIIFAQTAFEKTASEQASVHGADPSPTPSALSTPSEEGDTLEDVPDPFVPCFPPKPEAAITVKPSTTQSTEESRAEFDYSSLKVTGLVWGGQKPKAIIDGNVVGIGDAVKEAKILDITKEGILFDYKGKQYLMKREGADTSLKSLNEAK